MKKFIIPLILVIGLIIFLLSFIEVGNTKKNQSNNSMIFAVTNLPESLDKVTNLSKEDENLICATSKGLVSLDKEGKVIPSLAKEINVKDNGIEYEFVLNDNIFWSNGDSITAKDIREYFKGLIKIEDEQNIRSLLDVYGANSFKKGEGTFEKGVAITANEKSITIRLNKKNDNFLIDLTKPQYRIRKYLPLWANIKNSYKDIVYSGQYSIKNIDQNKIELEENQKEDGKGKNITLVKDDNVELSMASYEIGERDLIFNPPINQLERLKNENKLFSYSSNDGIYLSIQNLDKGTSVAYRKELFKMIYSATDSFTNENSQVAEPAEGSYFREDKENLEKIQSRKVSINNAQEITKPKVLTLLGEDTETIRNYCRYLADWFKEKENIQLKYYLINKKDIEELKVRDKYDMVLINCIEDNKNISGLYEQFRYLCNEEEKSYLINPAGAEVKFFDSYRILPIMFVKNNVVVSNKISNVNFDGNENIEFSSIN
ncbi:MULTISPECIES: ABC transporter substrate-binding protein [Clostridium]|uniref:Peptide ABC transporter substrate-binding protein n=1 Tax=Clostridium cibarium TaxID=2762247 RepID=A0ABR8PY72_9CLOT|nr:MULTISPECIES: ABC transporter substrate-binding protein [Clostridium]MBD7913123.1 peptide ABC transporter substrate-binding protein [Clostridium cibarium]